MPEHVYLDWNATTPLVAKPGRRWPPRWNLAANPSSVHAEGRQARRLVEEARATVANAGRALPRNVVFTSGRTEANALALKLGSGTAPGSQPERLRGFGDRACFGRWRRAVSRDAISTVGVTRSGVLDLDRLRAALEGKPPALVSIMLANNETGAVQPVLEAAEIVHAAGGMRTCRCDPGVRQDRVRYECAESRSADVSAHKIGGPKASARVVLAEGLQGFEPRCAAAARN